jgi:hypothetical protein
MPLLGGPFQCDGGGFCSHGAVACDDGGLKPGEMKIKLVSFHRYHAGNDTAKAPRERIAFN